VQSNTFDAIVVGSGNVEHIKDYVNAAKAPWEYPHRGGRTTAMAQRYPVLKRSFPLNEKTSNGGRRTKTRPTPNRNASTGIGRTWLADVR